MKKLIEIPDEIRWKLERIATENKMSLKKRSRSNSSLQEPSRKRICVEVHPSSWSEGNHYGMCGQSCPCCRSKIEGPSGFGTCPVCNAEESPDQLNLNTTAAPVLPAVKRSRSSDTQCIKNGYINKCNRKPKKG